MTKAECRSTDDGFRSRWTYVHGLPMFAKVATCGGPPVVLVHGVGMSGRYLMPTAALLAKDFNVYVPDLPGFGRSGKPERTLDLGELTDWLVAWMDEIGLEQPAMLGNSFGCQVVVELAVRYPARISRAVLQGPTIDPYWRSWHQQIMGFVLNGLRSPPSLGLIFIKDYADCGPRRFFETFQYALEDPIEDKLPHVRCPTMVVRGTADPFTSQTWVEQAAASLPDGCLRILPGAGHPANIDSPLQFTRVIRPFLAADAPADASENRRRREHNRLPPTAAGASAAFQPSHRNQEKLR